MADSKEAGSDQENLDDSDCVSFTLKEVLELEDEMYQESAALLGASNDKCCSYPDGYIKRQALYSCLTCIPESKTDIDKAGGVCLACIYHCHEGHELIELYTKRNFRCDCGNTKYPNGKCNLYNDKNPVNDMNLYNQNFTGVYCTCHRPYPDPEDTISDEMIQCVVCEDWYHTRHLGTEMPSSSFQDDEATAKTNNDSNGPEMICESCIKDHDFLLHYDALCLNNKSESAQVDVESNQQSKGKKPKTPGGCMKPKHKSQELVTKFFKDANWRKELCTCDDCLKMYEDEEITFLLDSEDPVHLYEERGKAAKAKELEEGAAKLISSLPRAAVLETIAGFHDMREKLGEYLKKFAENKKVVRSEDINEFFEGMKANKKMRR